MGKKITLHCDACGYDETFLLDVGPRDEQDAADTGAALYQQEKELLRTIPIQKYGAVPVKMSYGIYRCRSCGKIENVLQSTFHTGFSIIAPIYRCSGCGKMLGKVRPYKIKELRCPNCKGALQITGNETYDGGIEDTLYMVGGGKFMLRGDPVDDVWPIGKGFEISNDDLQDQ